MNVFLALHPGTQTFLNTRLQQRIDTGMQIYFNIVAVTNQNRKSVRLTNLTSRGPIRVIAGHHDVQSARSTGWGLLEDPTACLQRRGVSVVRGKASACFDFRNTLTLSTAFCECIGNDLQRRAFNERE